MPADELAFAETFIMARWRQRPSWDLEATSFNSEIAAQIAASQTDTAPIAAAKAWNALAERCDGFRLLHRYESRHRRDMSRAIRDLDYTRNLKLPNKPGHACLFAFSANSGRSVAAGRHPLATGLSLW